MEADEIDDAILELRRDRDAQRQRYDKLKADFDAFLNKFQPGTKFLVNLEYRLIYDTTLTLATGGPVETLIETRKDLQHAVYELSAKRTDTNGEAVIYGGTVSVVPGNSVQLALESRYNSSGPSVDTYLVSYNSKGSDVAVAVKIWRRLGMN